MALSVSLPLRKKPNAGFSLVEVVIGIFILAMTATIFGALVPSALKTGKMMGNHQQAASLVQHKVDQLRGVGYGRLTYAELKNAGIVDSSPTGSPYSFKTVDGLASLFVGVTGTVEVADAGANVRRVTVTITWTGSPMKQGNGTVTATALIARS